MHAAARRAVLLPATAFVVTIGIGLAVSLPHRPTQGRFDAVVVLGGGPIGLEMAQALACFGARVTVVLRGEKLLPKEDPDAAAIVRGALDALPAEERATSAATRPGMALISACTSSNLSRARRSR